MSDSPPIVVAMSGGLDSSAVAALLHRQGHRVVGMTMQLWNQRRLPELASDRTTGRCCSLDDVYDARHVAEQIGIPFYVINFEQQFEEHVVVPFVEEYLAGRTPIPCTLCNNFIKFDQFLEMADSVGATQVATGHYARVTRHPETGRYELRTAADASKDQTYFLFGLTQAQLARCLFPLGETKKTDVRALAREWGLPVAEKGESYEICFVPNGDYAAFLRAYLREQGIAMPETKGEIVTEEGRALGGTYRSSPFHRGPAQRFRGGNRRTSLCNFHGPGIASRYCRKGRKAPAGKPGGKRRKLDFLARARRACPCASENSQSPSSRAGYALSIGKWTRGSAV